LPLRNGDTLNTYSNRAFAPAAFPVQPGTLLGRFLLLAGILALDTVAVAYIPHTAPLIGPLAPFGIATYAVFLGLGYSSFKSDHEPLPFRWPFFAAHLVCIAAVWYANLVARPETIFLVASRVTLFLGIALLLPACIPLGKLWRVLRATNPLWLYATIAGALAWCLRYPMQTYWNNSTSAPGRFLVYLAFHSVYFLLRPLLPDVTADPETHILGTQRFAVRIAEACSGLEGLGLVLVFTVVWLWFFRKESRFAQALLLIPCALVCVWFLNIVRIAAIILIGNAGSSEIAMVGFHSQAGWIAFTAVALGFSMATRKISWVRRHYATVPTADGSGAELVEVHDSAEDSGEVPATSAYLVPFLAILAASFISRAASGYFEWLYPLRFAAAAIALWSFRAELRKLNWRFDWLGPVAGLLAFAVWILPALWTPRTHDSQLGETLAELSPSLRWLWIAFRVATAVITVSIAEELAFRGYLARRIMGRDFVSIPFRSLSTVAIFVSSVTFGLLHGQQWMAGIFAGLIFTLVLKRRGRFGDAVIAHAVSNLLLSVWVISRGDWSLW
jgi:exosortase E/protease (VPEID-CTERM system)